MKLAVSNIAWENDDLDAHLAMLRDSGCYGVEIAPSCIWAEPIDATKRQRSDLRKRVEDYGLKIIGIHSLLYTRPDLQLFESKASMEETGDYLKSLFALCSELNGHTLVFGSPRNRTLHGHDYKECFESASKFFAGLMPEAGNQDVTLMIEPLSKKETDFIQSTHEAHEMVQNISHQHFGLHLDVKAMIDSGENFQDIFKKYGQVACHLHVGDPGLAPPGHTGFDHKVIGDAIESSFYKRIISIEMKRGFGNTQDVLTNAIAYVKSCYPIDDAGIK